ncbi:MAG: ion transporter [Flavobacteriaceae bacterium]|jgi:voltage-gated potassium channel|nr:ion transporter [Flavobacteriaceae bacterium]MDG2387369.1 ion transporter [Flavobacteriaceae bacterium]
MKKMNRFDFFIYVLIIGNIVAMVLESHQSIQIRFSEFFHYFELISILIFSFEYLYRIVVSYKEKQWSGVKNYVFSFFGLIDLVSILPFYLKQFVLLDGRFFRILRLFRLTRVFKLGRDSKSLKLFIKALSAVKSELKFTLFLSVLTILFSASAIYFLENKAQPEVFSSITASIWWATVSLATVGYGDIVPVTIWGKVFASIISLVGIGIVAIPTGIISASFVEEIHNSKR